MDNKMSFDEFLNTIESNGFADVECICPKCNEEHTMKTLAKFITKKKYPLHKILKDAMSKDEKLKVVCRKCDAK